MTAAPVAVGQLLADGAQVPRPDVARVGKKAAFGGWVFCQKEPERARCLGRVAAHAGGHYVALGVVATPHFRLDVIDAQKFRFVHEPAVHAAKAVPCKDVCAFHSA